MATRKTIVNILLDETGSMMGARDETIGGFNEYLDVLKNMKGDVRFSLTKFNSEKVELVYNGVKMDKVEALSPDSYMPNAMTPLYDAIGRSVQAIEAGLEKSKGKPKVLFVVYTDGCENASREYGRDAIRQLITDKEEAGWDYVYLGVGREAWGAGQDLGIRDDRVMQRHARMSRQDFNTLGDITTAFCEATMGCRRRC